VARFLRASSGSRVSIATRMENRYNLAVEAHKAGNICLAQRDFIGARQLFERAIATAPTFAPGYNGLGCALHAQGDLEGAIASFRNAIATNGAYGEAADNLGVVLRERGDMAEAKHWLHRATELEPNNGRFLRHLVDTERIAAEDPIVEHVAAVAAMDEALPLESRIEALFAHAKVQGDLGNGAQAFNTLVRANRLRRGTIGYDENPLLQSFDLLARTFNRAFIEAARGHGDPSQRPIFIVGMPRSGTTLVEALLAAHGDIRGGGELVALEQCVIAMPKVDPTAPISALQSAFRALGSAYVRVTDDLAAGAPRLTDKMPFNFRFVPLIHIALPNAKIIHVRRNPLDVAYSCFATHFVDSVPFSYDLTELGHYYAAYERLMAAWRAALPTDTMLEVAYEQVVGDVDTQARRIVAHCGLAWDDNVLRFHESRYPVRSASQSQVRRPLYATSVGRAAALREQLQPFEDALGRTL